MRMLGLIAGVSGVLVAAASGCGKPFEAGSGGAGTTSTTSSGGGEGGASAGGGGAGGAGGGNQGGGGSGGCDPADASSCPAGEYCVASTGACAPCAVIGDALQFGPPEVLDVMPPGENPAFPRSRLQGGVEELVFVVKGESGASGDTDIAVTTRTANGWTPATYMDGDAVNTSAAEWAPLYLPDGVEIPGVAINTDLLLFSAVVASKRRVFAASPGASSRAQLPGVNDITYDSYSFALAHAATPLRYWYMRTGGVSFQPALVTQVPGEGPLSVEEISLPGATCPVNVSSTIDLAPWVTPSGEHLLFHTPWTSSCGGTNTWRSFFVKVSPADGQPVNAESRELEIAGLEPDDDVRTPSLSPDLCSVYFASSLDGSPKLYSARRR